MDNQKVEVLILLDLFATFDMVNHTILLKRLKNELVFSGKALAWFRTFLESRFEQVKIGRQCSSKQKLEYGVPQGSVLGPQLFNVYTASLGAHGLECNFYADDTQTYISVKPMQGDKDDAVSNIQLCFEEIRIWMEKNFLKLNDDKTKVFVFGSRQKISKITTR